LPPTSTLFPYTTLFRSARAPALRHSEVAPGPTDVLSLIGNTPLLRLEKVARRFPEVELYGKAEWANPGGSVKDRPAMNIIREARSEEHTSELQSLAYLV